MVPKLTRSAFGRAALLSLGVALVFLSGPRFADAANGSVEYAYDALGRVSSVSYDTGVIVIYTYDANGNVSVRRRPRFEYAALARTMGYFAQRQGSSSSIRWIE